MFFISPVMVLCLAIFFTTFAPVFLSAVQLKAIFTAGLFTIFTFYHNNHLIF